MPNASQTLDNDTNDSHGSQIGIGLNNDSTGMVKRISKNEQATTEFECQECMRSIERFLATDKKKWTNHMRVDHPVPYERSKTVAKKRIEWSNGKDGTLAALEIKFKEETKE